MSVDAPDDAARPTRSGPEAVPPAASGLLAAVVVEYEGTADRRTVYPPDASEDERLTRWISADDDAFVRLDLRR
ncbi:MAG: hypothetical protein ABEJ61_07315 [Haloferacaceae archaeon]